MFEEVLRAYGLDTAFEIEKERKAYKVETESLKVCLKERTFDSDVYKFMFSLFEHLEEKNFTNIPRYLKTVKGNKFTCKRGNYFYTLCKWIDSRRVNYDYFEELKGATRLIANFHKNSAGMDIKKLKANSEEIEKRVYYGRWIEIFSKKLKEMHEFKDTINLKTKKLTEFEKEYLNFFEKAIFDAESSIQNLLKTKYFEKSIKMEKEGFVCHHDLEYHNILIDEAGIYYLIDFDYMIADSYLHDLASLIIRNNKSIDFEPNIRHKTILDEYRTIIELDSDDIEQISEFIRFPEDYWQVSRQYFKEDLPWPEERYLRRIRKYTNCRDERLSKVEMIKEYKGEVK